MVPMDLNFDFQGLALIQGQIYNPVKTITYTQKESPSSRFQFLLGEKGGPTFR